MYKRQINSLEDGITTLKGYIDPNEGIISLAGFPSMAQFAPDLMVRYQSEKMCIRDSISTDEMVGKIEAAVATREDPDMVIIARTDAPFEEAIERANAYMEAGADMVKILPKSRQELEALPPRVNAVSYTHLDVYKRQVDYNVIPVSHDDAVSVNLLSGRICNSNFMYQTSCEHGLLPKSNKIFPGIDGQGSSVLHCNADGKIAQFGQGFQMCIRDSHRRALFRYD